MNKDVLNRLRASIPAGAESYEYTSVSVAVLRAVVEAIDMVRAQALADAAAMLDRISKGYEAKGSGFASDLVDECAADIRALQ